MAYSWSAGGFRRERRLAALAGALVGSLACAAATAPAEAQAPPPFDPASALIKAETQRLEASQRSWNYRDALFLYGQYLVYKRTKDPSHLKYLKAWGDKNVKTDGTPKIEDGTSTDDCDRDGQPDSLNARSLDYLSPGRMAVILHRETGERRYLLAARKIRAQFGIYPRTSDGGFWHGCRLDGQLWADGAYMSTSFLLAYADAFPAEAGAARDLAAQQLEVYGSHLQQPATGLLRHAYDHTRVGDQRAPWANRETGLSPEVWCRAVGWYGVSLVDTLEVLTVANRRHPSRPALLKRLRDLALGLERYQDRVTGRWFQVVDKGANPDNWVETSCSAMHAYTLSRAARRGWVGPRFKAIADNAFRGVLGTVFSDDGGATARIEGTVQGTEVGGLAYYLGRQQKDNDLHGIGAFLIMHEHMAGLPAATAPR